MTDFETRPTLARAIVVAISAIGLIGVLDQRSVAGSGPEHDPKPSDRILLGIGATSFGGLSGNFVARGDANTEITPPPTIPVHCPIVKFSSLDLLSRSALPWPFTYGSRTYLDLREAHAGDAPTADGHYADPYIRVEDTSPRPIGRP